MTIIDIVGIGAAILLLAVLWTRPAGVVGIVLALVLAGAGIAVTWQGLDQQRRHQADVDAFHQRQAATPTIAAPPPDHPRAGS